VAGERGGAGRGAGRRGAAAPGGRQRVCVPSGMRGPALNTPAIKSPTDVLVADGAEVVLAVHVAPSGGRVLGGEGGGLRGPGARRGGAAAGWGQAAAGRSRCRRRRHDPPSTPKRGAPVPGRGEVGLGQALVGALGEAAGRGRGERARARRRRLPRCAARCVARTRPPGGGEIGGTARGARAAAAGPAAPTRLSRRPEATGAPGLAPRPPAGPWAPGAQGSTPRATAPGPRPPPNPLTRARPSARRGPAASWPTGWGPGSPRSR
jgi:hypothetical protein